MPRICPISISGSMKLACDPRCNLYHNEKCLIKVYLMEKTNSSEEDKQD